MSGPFGSSPWGYNPGGNFYPHTIDQSLRFEDGDSAYLTRDPSSAGDRQKFTLSFWMKRGNLSSILDPFSAGNSSTDRFEVMLTSSNNLQVYMNTGGTIEQITTTQVFRDVSAWYHIVLAFDTTDGTAANRLKVYVNGSQVTSFSTYDMSTVNFSTPVNSTSNQYIGKRNYVDDRYYDGYLAEFYNIDGTQLTPASFGETKDGIWIPKAYSGSYGTNGFHLPFSVTQGNSVNYTGSNSIRWTNASQYDIASDDDFCLEFFIKADLEAKTSYAVGQYATAGPHFMLQLGSGTTGQIYAYYGNGLANNFDTSAYMTSTDWHHFAYVRESGTYRFYIDGVQRHTATNGGTSAHDLSQFEVGNVFAAAPAYFEGSLSNLRFTIGAARYGSGTTFTVPTSTLTNDSSNVKLLAFTTSTLTADASTAAVSGSITAGTPVFRRDNPFSNIIGKDAAGSNDFLSSGLFFTDIVPDSPTNNFATLNPLSKGSGTITFSEGNLKSSTSANLAAAENGATFTIPKSGKWYWEASYTGAYTNGGMATIMGIMDIDTQTVGLSGNHITNTTGEYVTYYSHNNGVYVSNSLTNYTGQITTQTDATVGFALDMDNGHLWIHVNGTYINGTPNFSNGTNKIASPTTTKTFLPFFGGAGGAAFTWRANFGQDSEGISSAQSPDNGIGTFEYDVPADYKALCSANLSEPEIIDGTNNFNMVLWTGNETARSITGVGFSPDLCWMKSRSDASGHRLYDTVRGATKGLSSDGVATEYTESGLTSFDADGFSLGTQVGTNGDDKLMVGWNWLAGTAFSNSAGANGANVDSSGQVNTKAGFSIVSWQYTTSADNLIAHGLSSAPEMMIVKSRTNGYNWDVYHTALSAPTKRFILNGTTSSTGAGGEVAGFFDTAPTDTLFEYNTSAATNNDNMIAYCFHSVEGYSKIGTYSGNNDSTDGTFVYTGFRPAWVLIKLYNSAGQWWGVYDSARDPDNLVTQRLWWNASNGESAYSGDELDFLSNGFKLRGNYSSINASYNYLYLAFAEQPFKFANAR